MNRTKEAVARRLGEAHFAVEPGISRIYRLVSSADREQDPLEPVKLLEVNENTTADGVVPVFFGSHSPSGVFYPSVIVEVTPLEYEQILHDPKLLPNGWKIAEQVPRPALAGVENG